MSVRSRAALAEAPVPVTKVFGPGVPPAIEAAEARSQMTPASPFSPGTPVPPYDGYSRQPRSQDFGTGYNIATRPRTHERVSFETLKGLVGAYDVADICIWHRIDSIRALDWKLVAADHYDGDVTDIIPVGLKALEKPDRVHYLETWLGKWLYDVLAYDAGALYRLRNRAGRCIGLMPVDGTTIAPLLDYWGNPPGAMAAPGETLPESHVQYVNGLPWNWLTLGDLVYEPYRMHNDSPYGKAPIETIILNANTDIRFQLYFLQRFTDGNLPAAFASAPESWSPEQIEQFQELWDGFMLGDQSRKSQIRWLPPGSKFTWSNEKDFQDHFSLFLMRKTAAAYHVVPADLGFTENVNKSSGESQGDVSHRVGDAPFIRYIQRILSSFLQADLGLPLKFAFDLGEEQADRIQQAQADKIYVDMGAVGPSEIREWRYGRSDPEPVPRYIFTERAGPIPIASLLAVAGQVDPASGIPDPGAALPHKVFGGTEGVLPNPPIKVMSLAEQEYGESAMPPAPPPQPKMTAADETAPGQPVAKEGEGAAGNVTTGITTETGLTSYDLIGRDDDEDDEAEVAKEMAAFRRFAKARRRAGEWRDFDFRAVTPVRGHNLNDAGRLAVRKASGEVAVAGLAVLAADTGRVLMLQRALDEDDPAAGKIEFPGGHLDNGESPLQGAWREFCEETGCPPPPGVQTGSWTAGDGIYQGIVWTTESEDSVPVRGGAVIPNPDADPDGDSAEAVMWVDPADLPSNPMVRAELAASLPDVLPLLGCAPGDGCCGADCCSGGCCDGDSGCQCGPAGTVAKAGDGRPKGPAWHGWTLDLKTAAHWAPKVRAAVTSALPKDRLRDLGRDYLAAHPDQKGDEPGKRDRNKAASAWTASWLAKRKTDLGVAQYAQGIVTDGYAIGAVSAAHQVTGKSPAASEPGDEQGAQKQVEDAGLAAALALLLQGGKDSAPAAETVAEAIESGYLGSLAIILAGADADWADSQESLDELGDTLSSALADEDLAATLVGTEIGIYTGLSAQDYYLANSVAWVSWQTMDDGRVCKVCLVNEEAGPVLLGQPFPSGHTAPPVHPKCAQRCAIVPDSPPGS